jgi:DNA-binding SARP family transcriptional activator/Tfp pilus assembly protein PilF
VSGWTILSRTRRIRYFGLCPSPKEHDDIVAPRAGKATGLPTGLRAGDGAARGISLSGRPVGIPGDLGDRWAAAVRFEVLGPLRAWRGDSALSLGPVQRRVVLAVLLLHANRPLGREQIIDAVWGPAAPAYAVNLLQKHVSALRRVLEPDRSDREPSQVLTWTDAGYLLSVPAGRLDLEVFDRAVTRARAARAAGNLTAAADALRTALDLWRGPVCDGLTSPVLDAERDRLAERRYTAIEERVEVEMALGNHLDLVSELRQLVADQPLRERLRGLLMLVLYRCGRQAEALAAFHDARRHLLAELGVEPSPQLQRLHQQILAADPSLAAPVTAAPGPAAGAGAEPAAAADPAAGPPTPAQLPYGMPDFTGRDAELERLHALLAARASRDGGRGGIIAITGTAGVGKTALAVHWAQQVRDQFPDGQLYVNLRGFDPTGAAVDPTEAIRGFLDAMAVPSQLIPVDREARAALFRSLLAGRRILLVLDNARNADQIRPMLPGSPGCLVVVTSRNQLTGLVAAEAADALAIDLLSFADARRLLSRRLGPDRVAAEPRAVDQIITSCARLPLVLAIVAARAATRPGFPLSVLADQLREARGSLDAFEGEDESTDARAVFSWSYQTLGPEAAQMFRLLALHPSSDVSVPVAASLAGVPRREASALLTALARAHLVNEQAPGRFAFHDLLGAYATEEAQAHDPEPVRRAAFARMLDHYLRSAHSADRCLDPHRPALTMPPQQPGVTPETFTDHARAMAWFTTEHSVLLSAVTRAASSGFDVHAWQLAWTLTTFLDRRGHWRDSAAVQSAALGAARRLADPLAQARAHRGLARAYLQLGRDEIGGKHLVRALELYEQLGDETGQARIHLNLAHYVETQKRPKEALDHVLRALELFRAADDRVGQAGALNAVGWYSVQLGSKQEAIELCQRALTLHQETGDRVGEAHTWDTLGYAHTQLGNQEEAIACYRRALELWRDLGDRYYEANAYTRLGDIHHTAGDVESARAAWREALAILDEFGHPDADRLQSRLVDVDGAPAPGGPGGPRQLHGGTIPGQRRPTALTP